MEILSTQFLYALASIVIIDLVLAGDNALLIAMAACNLPKEFQKKVIFWGTAGAVVIRSMMTLAVVWLLKIPGLLAIGGIILLWIAFKLLTEEKKCDELKCDSSIMSAITSIIVADTVMGIDNVLAVAGAAHGNFLLVILGLLISVPIMVWGSTFIINWIDKYPVIIYIGAGILALTAGGMILDEVNKHFILHNLVKWGINIFIAALVLLTGHYTKTKNATIVNTNNS